MRKRGGEDREGERGGESWENDGQGGTTLNRVRVQRLAGQLYSGRDDKTTGGGGGTVR